MSITVSVTAPSRIEVLNSTIDSSYADTLTDAGLPNQLQDLHEATAKSVQAQVDAASDRIAATHDETLIRWHTNLRDVLASNPKATILVFVQ